MNRVLFFAPFGQWSVHHQLDAVLASALRVRGSEVQVLGCDGVFSPCDVLASSGADAAKVCQACAAQSKRFFGKFELPLRQLRSFLAPADFERARKWSIDLDVTAYATATFEGLPIGEWATSSVLSHFRITAVNLHRPEVRSVHQGYLVNALLTWIALSRLLDEFPADSMVVFNGRFAPYRVAFEIAGARGIRVLGHERGRRPGSFILYEDNSWAEPHTIHDYIERWRQVPLSAADIEICSAMMNRQSGAKMNHPGFYDYRTEAAEIRHTLDIPTEARVLGVFTSSEFELALIPHLSSVTAQLDYVDRLIDVFRGRPDYLVVRHHPNIAGDAATLADHDFLRRAWTQAQSAPANVRIIMPSERLSSYGLIPHLSGAIAFFSSTGQESIARGTAAAALAQSHNHKSATFVIDDPTREGFARLVDQLFEKTAAFQAIDLRPCYRYVAAAAHRLSAKFESFEIKNFFSPEIRYQQDSDLLPGHDAMLDRACDFLVAGRPIFDLPGEANFQRSTAVEEAFFESEMTRLRESNWRQFSSADAPPCPIATVPVAVLRVGGSAQPPAWCARSRHRALVQRGQVESVGVSSQRLLAGLTAKLSTITERYVLIAHDSFTYDESFVRTAVQALEADEKLSGMRIGAWVARASGVIEGELFTPRHPCSNFHEACNMLPAIRQPATVLAFALFRTSCLVELLNQIPPAASAEEASRHLFAAMSESTFLQRNAPLAMIRPFVPVLSASAADATSTPLLFLIFNRPDLTQQVFETIRAQRPRKLFIAADGPRRQVPGERELCESTRRVVMDHIDWECEVKTLFREENLGCKHAVASAITWFFEHAEEGIILEDDCLPDPSFFRFCSELLQHYRDTPSVMMIGGVNYQQGRWRGDGSIFFSKYMHVWGWASWRRAWKHYDIEMAGLDELVASKAWAARCPDPAEAAYWKRTFTAVRQGKVDTWDYQWAYTMWKENGCAALPQVNLISNLGFRTDATHTVPGSSWVAQMATHPFDEIVFPSETAVNEEADAFSFQTVINPPAPPNPAAGTSKAGKAGKQRRSAEERLRDDFSTIKNSLAWKLVGKQVFSIEKRLRRLFGGRRSSSPPSGYSLIVQIKPAAHRTPRPRRSHTKQWSQCAAPCYAMSHGSHTSAGLDSNRSTRVSCHRSR